MRQEKPAENTSGYNGRMFICLIIIGAFSLRLALALSTEGMFGVDGGAYGLSVNTVLGDEPTKAGFPRPPLAPGWLLVPFVKFWGFDVGYKVWSATASLTPAVPVYLLARRIGRVGELAIRPLWVTPFAVGFIFVDLLHAEMFVTGALPLIAFGLLGTAWWAMGELCSPDERSATGDITSRVSRVNPRRRKACLSITMAISIGLIPWVNQTTAGLAVITLPIYMAGLLWYSRSWKGSVVGLRPSWPGSQSNLEVDSPPELDHEIGNPFPTHSFLPPRSPRHKPGAFWRLAIPMGVGGLIALTALPWYLDVLPGNGVLKYQGPVVFLTVATDSAWIQLALAWPMGALMMWKGEQPWLRSLGTLVILLGTLTVFLSYDETIINVFYRSRYLLPLPFWVGITWAVWRWGLPLFQSHPKSRIVHNPLSFFLI